MLNPYDPFARGNGPESIMSEMMQDMGGGLGGVMLGGLLGGGMLSDGGRPDLGSGGGSCSYSCCSCSSSGDGRSVQYSQSSRGVQQPGQEWVSETHRQYRDSSGTEKLGVSRIIGDRGRAIVAERLADGTERRTDNLLNHDIGSAFDREWSQHRGAAALQRQPRPQLAHAPGGRAIVSNTAPVTGVDVQVGTITTVQTSDRPHDNDFDTVTGAVCSGDDAEWVMLGGASGCEVEWHSVGHSGVTARQMCHPKQMARLRAAPPPHAEHWGTPASGELGVSIPRAAVGYHDEVCPVRRVSPRRQPVQEPR